jgi:hypothetical protein
MLSFVLTRCDVLWHHGCNNRLVREPRGNPVHAAFTYGQSHWHVLTISSSAVTSHVHISKRRLNVICLKEWRVKLIYSLKEDSLYIAGAEVPTAATMKGCDAVQFGRSSQTFGGSYCINVRGRELGQLSYRKKQGASSASSSPCAPRRPGQFIRNIWRC